MRPGQNNKQRMRGRPNNNRKGPNPLTRSYKSNGPDVKIRGTAHHIGEKYLQLARDAQSSGDPVTAESYLQHAEHYFRLIAMAQQAQQQSAAGYQRQPGEAVADEFDDGDDFTGIPDRFASPAERFAAPQPSYAPQPSVPQPAQDRGFYAGGNGQSEKPGFERPERGPRPERPFQDRAYQDRPYQDRGGQDRGAQDRYGPGRDQPREQGARDQESRGGGRNGRGPRDFRADAPRPQVEDAAPKGLPSFITAPVRPPAEAVADPLEAEAPVAAFSAVNEPEADREPNGFHLRPRRRRRSKSEMAVDQAASHDNSSEAEPSAEDIVGD